MNDESIVEAVIAAERTLLDPAIRRDRAALEQWLDPDFTEIGQSGRFWTSDEIFADLLSTDQSAYATAGLTDPRVLKLAENCYLLTFVVQVGDRRSRRSSIWRLCDDRLRIVFHQGTPIRFPNQSGSQRS